MLDVATTQAGAFISIATSNDENHPASNIIDANENTFWTTTGLYPQSFVVTFQQLTDFRAIQIVSSAIKHVVIEKSVNSHPIDFEPIAEKGESFGSV